MMARGDYPSVIDGWEKGRPDDPWADVPPPEPKSWPPLPDEPPF